jgi:hypothetical protein
MHIFSEKFSTKYKIGRSIAGANAEKITRCCKLATHKTQAVSACDQSAAELFKSVHDTSFPSSHLISIARIVAQPIWSNDFR